MTKEPTARTQMDKEAIVRELRERAAFNWNGNKDDKIDSALMRQAADLIERDGWQLIETAPRDGRMIILGRPSEIDEDGERTEGISTPGFWVEGYPDGPDVMGHDDGFADMNWDYFSPGRSMGAESYRRKPNGPTHWMPLPAAPHSDEPAGGKP